MFVGTRSGAFLQRTSLIPLFTLYIKDTDLLMRLQSQDHQELLLFGRQYVSSGVFFSDAKRPGLSAAELKFYLN